MQPRPLAASTEKASRVPTNGAAITPVPETAGAPERNKKTVLRRDEDLPRIVAKTQAFECGKGQFRLHVLAGDRELVFKMERLDDIVVQGVKSLEWNCGPLKPQTVTVVYQPSGNAKFAGTVSELIF